MLTLEIPRSILNEMVRHAEGEKPVEACGILAGVEGRVSRFYPMINADGSCEHFTLAPEEHFRVVKDMRAAGLSMQAVYHSHPATPPRPSAEDIRLAVMPGATYVILSLADPAGAVAKAFQIEDGVVTPTPIKIDEET